MKSAVCLSADLSIFLVFRSTDLYFSEFPFMLFFVSRIYNEICLLVGLFFSPAKKKTLLTRISLLARNIAKILATDRG